MGKDSFGEVQPENPNKYVHRLRLSPMIGMWRDVRGTFSATISRNTVKARSTEMPSEIFSPASGGRQKTTMTSTDRRVHGRMMFIT